MAGSTLDDDEGVQGQMWVTNQSAKSQWEWRNTDLNAPVGQGK